MKSWLIAVLMATVALTLAPNLAEAKRFGGGGSFGMQRSAPPPQRPAQPPAQQPNTPAQPASAAGTAAAGGAAAAGARSWLGPIAGIAAGIGLVALFSHLGLGAELANFVMLALMAVAAVVVIRLLMRRFGGVPAARPGLAGAGAGASPPWAQRAALNAGAEPQPLSAPAPRIGSALLPPLAVPGVGGAHDGAAPSLPAGFDREAFERIARAIFIRMQAANDAADLNDLRQFTTPEVFAELRLQLQERGPAPQHTDVPEVHAEVVDFAEDDGQQIVSVRYHGRVIEQAGDEAQPFDEVWHLVRPVDESRAWAIAGVQQREAA